jgi:hypothetical protein
MTMEAWRDEIAAGRPDPVHKVFRRAAGIPQLEQLLDENDQHLKT